MSFLSDLFKSKDENPKLNKQDIQGNDVQKVDANYIRKGKLLKK